MKRQPILATFFFFLLLCLLLILAGLLGLTRPLQAGVERLTVPLRMTVYRGWQGITGGLGGQGGLIAKDEREKAELQVELKVLQEENQALRKQLEAPLPASMTFLPAKTLGLTRYLTIDKGEKDGVKPGMLVVSENILVGKIARVTSATADILLPTDPDSKIPAKTLKTQARGLVIGQFGTQAILDRVVQAETLAVDDLVVTIGEGGYGRDLLIGKINKINKIEVEPFQKATINPLVNYNQLDNVFVIMEQ